MLVCVLFYEMLGYHIYCPNVFMSLSNSEEMIANCARISPTGLSHRNPVCAGGRGGGGGGDYMVCHLICNIACNISDCDYNYSDFLLLLTC